MAKPRNKLTAKQEVFVKEYVETLNGKQAALKANYSPKSATVIASENLTKPEIVDSILILMDKKGLTDDFLLDKHIEGLNATYLDQPDYKTRHKYLTTAYQLKGKLSNSGAQSGNTNIAFVINK